MTVLLSILAVYMFIGGGLGALLAGSLSDFFSIFFAWPVYLATGVISIQTENVDDEDDDSEKEQ